MRGQTITYELNRHEIRRSTKHMKIDDKCYPIRGNRRWDALMAIADDHDCHNDQDDGCQECTEREG